MISLKRPIDPRLVSLTKPTSLNAERYQTLRLNLQRIMAARGARMIALTSPTSGDGKTLTAINLSAAMARRSGTRVLLVEADFRRPAMAAQLGLAAHEAPGLADLVLDPTVTLARAVQPLQFGFSVITAGRPAVPIHEIFNSARLAALLCEVREQYDYVILDTPPVVPVSDTRLLMPSIDGLLLVVAAHKTPRKLVEEALNLIDSATVLGIVFNRGDHPLLGYGGRHYGREYESQVPRTR